MEIQSCWIQRSKVQSCGIPEAVALRSQPREPLGWLRMWEPGGFLELCQHRHRMFRSRVVISQTTCIHSACRCTDKNADRLVLGFQRPVIRTRSPPDEQTDNHSHTHTHTLTPHKTTTHPTTTTTKPPIILITFRTNTRTQQEEKAKQRHCVTECL